MRRKFASLLLLGALAFALAACGSKDNNSSPAGGSVSEPDTATQEIVIKAKNWEFDKKEYDVPKDTPVRITLELDGGHGIKIDGVKLGPGNESEVFTLKEGTYEFECTIMCGRGHNDMKAKLVVK